MVPGRADLRPDMPQAGRDGGEESGRRSPLAYRNGSQHPDQREIQGLRASAETVCAGLPDEETEGERRRTAQILYRRQPSGHHQQGDVRCSARGTPEAERLKGHVARKRRICLQGEMRMLRGLVRGDDLAFQ